MGKETASVLSEHQKEDDDCDQADSRTHDASAEQIHYVVFVGLTDGRRPKSQVGEKDCARCDYDRKDVKATDGNSYGTEAQTGQHGEARARRCADADYQDSSSGHEYHPAIRYPLGATYQSMTRVTYMTKGNPSRICRLC